MANYIHLSRAPIVEALIDFRVQPVEGRSAEDLKPIHEAIRDRYPTLRDARQSQTNLEFKDGKEVEHSTMSQMVGYRLESADGLHVLQAHLGGFTVSRLKPYHTWEALFDEASRLWKVYCDVAKPALITRVATRFINRIDISLASRIEFEDYLSAPPQIPKALPQIMSAFLTRVVVEDPTTGASIVLTQALEPPNPITNILPILLDIDVFKAASFGIDGNEHWQLLENFRQLKNEAFFGSVTPKTLDSLK